MYIIVFNFRVNRIKSDVMILGKKIKKEGGKCNFFKYRKWNNDFSWN